MQMFMNPIEFNSRNFDLIMASVWIVELFIALMSLAFLFGPFFCHFDSNSDTLHFFFYFFFLSPFSYQTQILFILVHFLFTELDVCACVMICTRYRVI